MKWYSVKKYEPKSLMPYIVMADIGEDNPIYFTAEWVGYEWDLEIMEKICIHDGPNNCIDVVGNNSFKITHFAIPDPVEIEE